MPEVAARKALSDRAVRVSVLAPFGNWIGRGTLRVLRVKAGENDALELVAGYESYERYQENPHG